MLREFQKAALEAALRGGQVLMEYLGRVQVSTKGEYATDLVTEADLAAERAIVAHLSAAFPQHGFFTEERTTDQTRREYMWLIDPLDGTTNYAHSFPFFSVSIALARGEELLVGVVYDPIRQELFSAQAGAPSTLNGRAIHVSAIDSLGRALLATGFPYDVASTQDDNIGHFKDFLVRTQAVRRPGSAALDLANVACGRLEGFWELKLSPWDYAAGALIVRQSGGTVSACDGSLLDLYHTEQILASNGILHKDIVAVLNLHPDAPQPRRR